MEKAEVITMHLHNKKELTDRRKILRKEATQAEKYLWYELRKSQICGKKFTL
jgi:very-short-patch-repair endonuclease